MEEDEMGGECSTDDMRNIYNILVGKPEAKRPLGKRNVGRIILLEWSIGR
jgi:hypothetical protein